MFKVNYIVSAGTLEKLLKATDDISIKHSNIEHVRVPEIIEHVQIQLSPNTRTEAVVARDVKKKRASGSDIIFLTSYRPRKGTIREKIVVALEKLEVKHGIGEVTRDMFRKRCTSLGLDPQVLYQLIAEGYVVSK